MKTMGVAIGLYFTKDELQDIDRLRNNPTRLAELYGIKVTPDDVHTLWIDSITSDEPSEFYTEEEYE